MKNNQNVVLVAFIVSLIATLGSLFLVKLWNSFLVQCVGIKEF